MPSVLQPDSSPNSARHDADPTLTGGLYLAYVVDVLRRRRWLILTITVCGALLAAVAGLLVPPKYTAGAQIIVDTTANAERQSSEQLDELAIDTQVKVFSSRDHLQQVVESLAADPEFVAIKQPPERAPQAAPRDKTNAVREPEASGLRELYRRFRIWTAAFTSHDDRKAVIGIDDLTRHLAVSQEGRSRVITITYTARNPEEAAIVVNRAVQLYIDGQNTQQQKYTSSELARLRQRIADARNDVIRSTAAVQAALQDASKGAQGGAGRDAGDRLQSLERDAAASAAAYANLERRQKDLLSQRDDVTAGARILSLATPPDRPSSHNPILFILPAMIVFLIGGSFIAVIADQNERTLRNERDVNEILGMPCVGLVPQLPRLRNMRAHQYMLTSPHSAYAESIRSVVSELWLTTPRNAPSTVLISSSVPGEGKTTAAVSISVCAAMLGRRALLIDLDFKRPAVARELATKTDKGFFDILLRSRPPAEVITHIQELGIDYLPMSTCPVDALPILASERVPRLLRQLSENYDCVVIDGPPILVLTETRFLVPMVDKVVFVVKWDSTRREVAQNAMNLLRPDEATDGKSNDPIVLLTQVDLKEHARYRYGDASEALVKYESYYSRPVRFSSRSDADAHDGRN